MREIAYATHGQVIEALQFAVGPAFGLDAGVLTDDRMARALDALAPVLEQVTGSIGAAAIGA